MSTTPAPTNSDDQMNSFDNSNVLPSPSQSSPMAAASTNTTLPTGSSVQSSTANAKPNADGQPKEPGQVFISNINQPFQ